MIPGYFRPDGGRLRPFLTAHLALPDHDIAGEVHFLVDTGADSTVLAPADTLFLGIDVGRLPPGPASTGVGGMTRTAFADARLDLGDRTMGFQLRILAPSTTAQKRALMRIPSLLGRDVLAHFALFMEERSSRLFLLEPDEASRLRLP